MAESRRLVLVEWVDSSGCSSIWTEMEDVVTPTLPVCRSVGWLYHDGEDCKVVVPHVAGETPHGKEQGCGDMTIPTRAVVRMVDLLEGAGMLNERFREPGTNDSLRVRELYRALDKLGDPILPGSPYLEDELRARGAFACAVADGASVEEGLAAARSLRKEEIARAADQAMGISPGNSNLCGAVPKGFP